MDQLDFDKVADNLERMVASLGEVYCATVVQAATVAAARAWLQELSCALRSVPKPYPRRYEPSLN